MSSLDPPLQSLINRKSYIVVALLHDWEKVLEKKFDFYFFKAMFVA